MSAVPQTLQHAGVTGMDAAGDPALRAQAERLRCMLHGDVVGLRRLLHGALRYVHSDGSIDGRDQFVQRLRREPNRYAGLDLIDPVARRFGQLAVLDGSLVMRLRRGDEVRCSLLRYTEVARLHRGRWVMLRWQSTRAGDAPA